MCPHVSTPLSMHAPVFALINNTLQTGPQETPSCGQRPTNPKSGTYLQAHSQAQQRGPSLDKLPLLRERWGTLTACRRARCQTVSEALHFRIYPRRIVTRCNNPLESQRPRLGDFIGPLTWTTKFFREDISRDRQFRQVVFSI